MAGKKKTPELDELKKKLEEMTKERDAYKKAKQENDERFMRERDDARAKAEEFRLEMDKQTEMKKQERQEKLDLLRENEKLKETLKVRTEVNQATLARSNALEELVAAHEKAAQTVGVLQEVQQERERQNIKWGIQNHPDGTCAGPNGAITAKQHADAARSVCDQMAKLGKLTWSHILTEELMEAYAETEAPKLRKELIQVAAVATQWVECIDRRGNGRAG